MVLPPKRNVSKAEDVVLMASANNRTTAEGKVPVVAAPNRYRSVRDRTHGRGSGGSKGWGCESLGAFLAGQQTNTRPTSISSNPSNREPITSSAS